MNRSSGIAKRRPERLSRATQLFTLLVLTLAALHARPALADGPEPRFVLKGHPGYITVLTFSPDGHTLATSSSRGAIDRVNHFIKLWNVATGKIQRTLEVECSVEGVAFSPSGKLLAVACGKWTSRRGDYTSLTIWDINSGKRERTLSDPTVHSVEKDLIFSRDGKTLFADSQDRVVLWDVETWRVRSTILVGAAPGFSMDLAPDGQSIATADCSLSGRDSLSIWDAATGNLTATLDRRARNASSPQFAPNGKYLAACTSDNCVKVWYVSTRELIKIFPSSNGRVFPVRYSPDGKLLAAGYERGGVIVWDSVTFQERAQLRTDIGSFGNLAFSPDSKLLATSGGGTDKQTVKIWDVSQILSASPAKTPATKPSSRGVQPLKKPAKR